MAPDLTKLLKWGPPREVQTKRGPRILRKTKPDPEFWELLWIPHSQEYSRMGFSVSPDLQNEKVFWLCWWNELTPEELEKRAKNSQLSVASSTDFEPPKPAGLEYYPFQKVGVQFCLDKVGTYLADEMGLGKTIQAIGVINVVQEIERVLVVTKASLKTNWKRELKKWLVRPLSVDVGDSQRFPKSQVVVINYDVLSKHYHSLREKPWDLVILDEAQQIRNRKNKRTIAVVGYRPSKKKQAEGERVYEAIPAKKRIAISGTPFENTPEEIWTILNYLDPERFQSFYGFAIKYCGWKRGDHIMSKDGEKDLAGLQRLLRSTIMIRRMKAEVMPELPAKTREVFEMDPKGFEKFIHLEQYTYEKHEADLIEAQARTELARAADSYDEFRSSIRNLQRVRIAFDELARVRKETAIAKLEPLKELLADDIAEAGKVLVFGHHKELLVPLHRHFTKSVLITGETPAQDRQAICDKFQDVPWITPFFGSMRACGEGLNLTAARLVVFIEEDWTPSKVSQAEDRAHRIGQKGNVLVRHYIVPGTIDARMLNTTLEKQHLMDDALNCDPGEWAKEATFTSYRPLAKRNELLSEGMLLTANDLIGIRSRLEEFEPSDAVDRRIVEILLDQPSISRAEAALSARLLRKYANRPATKSAPVLQEAVQPELL